MNEPIPLSQRDPVTIDELISASLDGVLDEAALDLGFALAEAHSIVADHPDRAAALGASRDLTATPAPLDEMTRRRLVSTALSAPPSLGNGGMSRRHRRRASIAGIAAALVLLAAVGALVAGLSGGGRADRSAGGAAQSDATVLGPTLDFGEVSDPAVLRTQLRDVGAPLPGAAAARAENGSPGGGEDLRTVESAPPPDASSAATTPAGALDAGASPASPPDDAASDCVALLAAELEGVGTPSIVATATFQGEPAGVVVLSSSDSSTAVVYSAGDCAILATQSLATR